MTKIRNEGKRNTYRGKQHVKKSRSKRNRQRPKGGIGIVVGFDTDISATAADRATSPQVQIDILPLKFPGDDVDTNNRVRVVRPYPFTFATFAKERWLGRTVLDIYSKEFGSYPTCYYETAINEGRILVNGEKIDCEYKVKGNDELAHVVHRHEPVVAISPSLAGLISQKPYIHIVHEDGNIIVVDKPSTLPVHPCGGYNLNSLFHILADQCPELKDNLFTVHRLDRLTSGLTIIAKNTETAKILGKCITDRDSCHKVYLARVKGKFPLQAPPASRLTIEKSTVFPLNGEWFCPENEDKHGTAATCFWMSDKSGKADAEKSLTDVFENRTDISKLREDGTADDSLWLNLSVPVEIIDPKKGVCKAGNGKVAQTAFTVVGYDEETDSTLVLAKPMTGRTHQIRLHLQYLCHPIGNDPNYGGELYYGNSHDKEICRKSQERMKEFDADTNSAERPENSTSSDTPATEEELAKAGIGLDSRRQDESLLEYIKRTCVWCQRSKGDDRSVLEFLIRSPGIWLHALQYQMEGPDGTICYRTKFPKWSLGIGNA